MLSLGHFLLPHLSSTLLCRVASLDDKALFSSYEIVIREEPVIALLISYLSLFFSPPIYFYLPI